MYFKPSSQHSLERKLSEIRARPHIPRERVEVLASVCSAQVEEARLLEQKTLSDIAAISTSTLQHRQGALLLPRADFDYDRDSVARLYTRLMPMLSAQPGSLGKLAAEMRERCDVPAACRDFLAGTLELPSETAIGIISPAAFIRFAVQSILTPSLALRGHILGRMHDAQTPWAYGSCPVCGSLPLIDNLRGPEGHRWSCCSFCRFEYRVPRLACPCCHADDPAGDTWEYYSTPEAPYYQICACKQCGCYIKLADLRGTDSEFIGVLDDLNSLALDFAAQQLNLRRTTPSAWGF